MTNLQYLKQRLEILRDKSDSLEYEKKETEVESEVRVAKIEGRQEAIMQEIHSITTQINSARKGVKK